MKNDIPRMPEPVENGMMIFIMTDSVYRTVFKELIPQYEKNVSGGVEWPGRVDDVRRLVAKGRIAPKPSHWR